MKDNNFVVFPAQKFVFLLALAASYSWVDQLTRDGENKVLFVFGFGFSFFPIPLIYSFGFARALLRN